MSENFRQAINTPDETTRAATARLLHEAQAPRETSSKTALYGTAIALTAAAGIAYAFHGRANGLFAAEASATSRAEGLFASVAGRGEGVLPSVPKFSAAESAFGAVPKIGVAESSLDAVSKIGTAESALRAVPKFGTAERALSKFAGSGQSELAAPAIVKHENLGFKEVGQSVGGQLPFELDIAKSLGLRKEPPLFTQRQLFPANPAPDFEAARDRFATIVPDVVSRNRDKILQIFVNGSDNATYASSAFVLPNGEIATALHALKGADGRTRPIFGMFDQAPGVVPLQFRTSRRDLDLAVLRAPGQSARLNVMGPHILRPETAPLQPGELVLGLGHPENMRELVAHPGIVRGMIERPLPAPDGKLHNMYRNEMIVGNGNSGGPMYDAQGRLTSMIVQRKLTSKISDEQISYSVPIGDIMRSLGS